MRPKVTIQDKYTTILWLQIYTLTKCSRGTDVAVLVLANNSGSRPSSILISTLTWILVDAGPKFKISDGWSRFDFSSVWYLYSYVRPDREMGNVEMRWSGQLAARLAVFVFRLAGSRLSDTPRPGYNFSLLVASVISNLKSRLNQICRQCV